MKSTPREEQAGYEAPRILAVEAVEAQLYRCKGAGNASHGFNGNGNSFGS